MSDGKSSIGSCMAFAAAAPGSADETGFAALTWSASSEEVNIGDVGPENEVIKYQTVCNGKVNKRMGATDFGQQTLLLAFAKDNAAQGILKAAAISKDPVSVRETLPGGTIYYYQAYVASAKTQAGGGTDYVRLSVSLEIDSTWVEVAP